MSKLGNISESFGKQIGIAIANTNGENVLASTILPKNNIIISSPVDADANDIGTYAMFITDNNGVPVRLSYTIQTGNGLNVDPNNADVVKLTIDKKTLKENNGVLLLSTKDIADGNTLFTNEKSQLQVNTYALTVATNEQSGLIGLDDYTVKSNQNGNIYVETENLDRANESQVGVVISDNKTVHIDSDGVIHVNTSALKYGCSDHAGVVKYDEKTLYTSYDYLKVNTNGLKYATNTTYGVSKCDGYTVTSNNGVYSVNVDNLNKCSDTVFGVVKSDDNSTVVNNDTMCVREYDKIVSNINNIMSRIESVKEKIYALSNSLSNATIVNITDPTIFTFMCTSVTSANLTRPEYGTFPDDFIQETITAEFVVNTNCPFIVTITYMDNVSPNIYLYEINYDDLDTYPGDVGLYNEFQSTSCTDKILRFSWICKNYSSSNGVESVSTRIKITISYSKDNTVSKSVYYNIIRYNSLYNKKQIGKTILIANSDGKLSIDNTISVSDKRKRINKKQTT